MNIKSALITAAVQLLVANTNLVRKASPAEEFINTFLGGETQEQRIIRETEEVVDKTVAAAKKISTNRKFKKIIHHV